MKTNMMRLMSESGTILIDEKEDVMVVITTEGTFLFHLGSMPTEDISEFMGYLSGLQARKMPPPPPEPTYQQPPQYQQPAPLPPGYELPAAKRSVIDDVKKTLGMGKKKGGKK